MSCRPGGAPSQAAPVLWNQAPGDLFRERWYDPRTGTFLTPDAYGTRDSSNLYPYCAGQPINCEDPLGLARQTKNGGTNWFGNVGDVVEVWNGPWYVRNATQTISGGLDFFGNTLSELLLLDVWADVSVVVGDSSRATGQRAWAATKGVGIAAVNLVGGEIIGTVGKVLLEIPGAKTVVGKIANSAIGRVLAIDVKVLTSGTARRAATRSSTRSFANWGGEFLDDLRAVDVQGPGFT